MQITFKNNPTPQPQNNLTISNNDYKQAKNKAISMSLGISTAMLATGGIGLSRQMNSEMDDAIKKNTLGKQVEKEITDKIKKSKLKEFGLGAALIGLFGFFEYKTTLLDELLKNKIKKDE